MKKNLGLLFLLLINGSALYLIYLYIIVACSTMKNNIFHIPYEPSGMQIFYYFISLPLFLVLAFLSRIHSYYYDLKTCLAYGFFCIWLSYFLLILYVDQVIHFPSGKPPFYYGSLIISLGAISYILFSTYFQYKQLNQAVA
ncbi:MAG: hypothetical protein LEGION0403_FIIPPAGN_02684 [Legionella sp.]|uniref:hypothetical protein n=1 Tax=Legionella sp. TaxID=459 RepID=UPI003D096905